MCCMHVPNAWVSLCRWSWHMVHAGAEAADEEEGEEQHHEQQAEEGAANGALVPDFADPEMDPDEALSDEDAPDLQDEIAKTLTSLRVR